VGQTAQQPSIFVGSTSEGQDLANAVHVELEQLGFVPTTWNLVFEPGRTTWSELVRARTEFDAAVFVLTPDDLRVSRDASASVPRDNLILEAGLFVGRLGPDRVFLVLPDAEPPSLPSDWAGLVYLTYAKQRRTGRLPRAAVHSACLRIGEVLPDRVSASEVTQAPPSTTGFASIGVERSDDRSHTEMWRVTPRGTIEHRWLPRDAEKRCDWQWEEWTDFPCPVVAVDVAAVNGWRTDHAEVFVLGTDGRVVHKWWWLEQEPRWSDWLDLPVATEDPRPALAITAAGKRDGRMDVYVQYADQRVRVYEFRHDEHDWRLGKLLV
jgi:hypothetical protein